VVDMTTADPHSLPSCPLVTDRALGSARDTSSTRSTAPAGRRQRPEDEGALRRLGRWALEELRDGAEMSARRDAVRTSDERRFLERP